MKKFLIRILLLVIVMCSCNCMCSLADEFIEFDIHEVELNNKISPKIILTDEKINFRVNNNSYNKTSIKNNYYQDEINATLGKYIEISVMYDMSDEENEYVMRLVNEGYDLEKILQLYDFVMKTNKDISCIKDIYDIAAPDFEGDLWIENAYDEYLGEESCILSIEDVATYVKKGISIDEILLCYELSLNNEKNIKQMLEERVSGKSWEDIVIPNIEIGNTKTNIDLKTITTAINVSKQTNSELKDVVEIDKKNQVVIKQDVLNKIADKKMRIRELKKLNGIVDYNDKTIIESAKKEIPQLSGEDVENLINCGYRIRDIKEAVFKTNVKKAPQVMRIINELGEV